MWVFILIGHLCLSGIWFGVVPRMNIKKIMCLKEIGLYVQKYMNRSMLDNQHNQDESRPI